MKSIKELKNTIIADSYTKQGVKKYIDMTTEIIIDSIYDELHWLKNNISVNGDLSREYDGYLERLKPAINKGDTFEVVRIIIEWADMQRESLSKIQDILHKIKERRLR